MGLLDDFKNEGVLPRVRCQVAVTLEQLPKPDAADLAAAVADLTVTAAAIERVLQRRGVKLSQATITRHRRKGCNCE